MSATHPPAPSQSARDVEMAQRLGESFQACLSEVRKVIVGMDTVIEELMICVFCRGHCLMVGVPGLAKTLLVSTLSRVMDLSYSRVQFTPDLMPADITGTDIIQEDPETGRRKFEFLKGPLFANMILADEINRTPPKTQAALLQAMQEHKVTVGEETYELDEPFFVLATQNPIEQEGTYPLPEAQLDRFMFLVNVDYPSRDEEMEIARRTTGLHESSPLPALSGAQIMELQQLVRKVPVADYIVEYAVDLVRCTRAKDPSAPDFVKHWVAWGAGPRAVQNLLLGGKARALLRGRFYVQTDDILAVAGPVLRHRIVTNFNADAEGVTTDDIVAKILQAIPRKTEQQLV